MSSPHIARSITNTIRHLGRSRPRPFHTTVQRAASTKHPRGFVPPTTDDLAELRERVQEFTREPWSVSPQNMASEAKIRARNNGRSCCKHGPRERLSFRHMEKVRGSRVWRIQDLELILELIVRKLSGYHGGWGLRRASNGLSGALYRHGGDQ